MDKLLPNVDSVTNADSICETVKRELFDKPLPELLENYITTHSKNITKSNYKCIITLQFASLSPIAMDLLSIIKNIIQTSEKMNNTNDLLLFVNIADNIINTLTPTHYLIYSHFVRNI